MQRTRGQAKSVRDLLNARFDIDYYQREYRWERSHVSQLVGDLATAFLKRHRVRAETIAGYERYFLGSIIINEHEGRRFIVDGQQRLTTITLLLIHVYRNLEEEYQKRACGALIFSHHPERGASFNLDIDERNECMGALFAGEPFDGAGRPDSVKNKTFGSGIQQNSRRSATASGACCSYQGGSTTTCGTGSTPRSAALRSIPTSRGGRTGTPRTAVGTCWS